MKPKQKAQELVKKMYGNIFDGGQYEDAEESWYNSKQCALIAVEEIIEATSMYQYGINNALEHIPAKIVKHPYWQEVKKEIENL